MTTIAAIIPVHNRARLVLEALASVASQTRRPDRLIVVDDGSTDDTRSRVDAWLAKSWRGPSAVISQSNRGPAAARNLGVTEAGDATLLAFLDSDDLWPADYLERMERAMVPGVVAASCDQRVIDAGGAQPERRSYEWIAQPDGPRTTAALLRHGPPGTPNTVFRAAAFHEAGGYDPAYSYGEDYHLMLKISLRGRWAYVPGDTVTVRKQATGESDQLSRTIADRRLQLAVMLQRFIDEEGGRDAVPQRLWRRRVARQWLHAGRQLAALGRSAEAADCFAKAVKVNPWSLAARWSAMRGK